MCFACEAGEQISQVSDEELLRRLCGVYAGWPSDGWEGAANAIAIYSNVAHEIEQELKVRHEKAGSHNSAHPYYKDQCACREPLVPC